MSGLGLVVYVSLIMYCVCYITTLTSSVNSFTELRACVRACVYTENCRMAPSNAKSWLRHCQKYLQPNPNPTLNLTVNLIRIPHKSNPNWAFVREWLASEVATTEVLSLRRVAGASNEQINVKNGV